MDNKITQVYIAKSGKTIKLKQKTINEDEAIINMLYKGLNLIFDPMRYSNDRFKTYTEKWGQ